MYKSFAYSAQGDSHIRNHKPCQDRADKFDGGDYCIVAAADGHGGEKYFRSGIGARLACDIGIRRAKDCMQQKRAFVNKWSDPDISDNEKKQLLVRLEESIIMEWRDKIQKHCSAHPFTMEELSVVEESRRQQFKDDFDQAVRAYGTTLLLAVLGEKFWFGLHIGDGTLVTVSDAGEFGRPIELDEHCAGHYTTSICNDSAIHYFHHAWGCEPLRGLFVATDGVDESFVTEEAFYNFYRQIITDAQSDFEGTIQDLVDYLPILSKKGSKDDVSVAGAVRVNDEPQPLTGAEDRDEPK